jgi:uncharacterized membrane protein
MKNRSLKTRTMTAAALMAAVIFVVTYIVRIPLPIGNGYINMGDAVIYLCALVLGNPLAAVAAGLGSGLADLAAGAVVYMIPTVLVKAGMAWTVASLIQKKKETSFQRYLAACLLGGLVMLAGYWLFEAIVFGTVYANLAFLFNIIQYIANVIVAAALKKVAQMLQTLTGL